MNPRYFVGVALPDDISRMVDLTRHGIESKQNIMKPLAPHITLLHPNILMTLSPLYFLPQVKEVASRMLPFSIELSKIDLFDKRVMYIAVKSPGLIELQEKLVRLLPPDVKARYQVGRKFTPHVTVMQAKPLQSLSDSIIDQVRTKLEAELPVKFECDTIHQFLQVKPREYIVKPIS